MWTSLHFEAIIFSHMSRWFVAEHYSQILPVSVRIKRAHNRGFNWNKVFGVGHMEGAGWLVSSAPVWAEQKSLGQGG